MQAPSIFSLLELHKLFHSQAFFHFCKIAWGLHFEALSKTDQAILQK
jgi:hypothetical protein